MTRRKNDWYPTAEAVTQTLLYYVPTIAGHVVEPCCGDGRMADVLRPKARIYKVTTNDIDPDWTADMHCDARDPHADIYRTQPDWIVTNPPYTQAARILKASWANARLGVGMLLRLTFLEPCRDRADWLEANGRFLSNVIILNPRPSFTENGKTDSVTSAWMVWKKGNRWNTEINFAQGWNECAT